MVGRRGKSYKRKVEELQDVDGKSKSAKEAKIEAISLDASQPAHVSLLTLKSDTWRHCESSSDWSEGYGSRISGVQEGKNNTLSQGTNWSGIPNPLSSQVTLSCRRVSSGRAFDCETQTYHFVPVSASKVVVVPDTDTLETIKVEIDTDQQEEFWNHPLICCVQECESRSDTDTAATFYTVPKGKERSFWTQMFDLQPCDEDGLRQHICNKHFITPTKMFPTKGKVRKKKTCDMLVAEEAEKIRQGLTSGRPKRTPKPNKNYDWAEIAPLIKSEPDEFSEESSIILDVSLEGSGGTPVNPRKYLISPAKEDKENTKPTSDSDPGREEEDDELDLENISLPSHPRPPPPKPKGRPHRIRDSCTQTESALSQPGPQLPLREVKIQCNMNTDPPSPCSTCSYVDWIRLEELIVDCVSKMEGDLCAPLVQECLRKVVDAVPHPTHATNVLKLLSGDERDELENASGIVLVPDQEDDVEIENVIHTTVEEPIEGVREIIPKTWQKKTKWKKSLEVMDAVSREEEEEDVDGLGIQEATEIDDDEFHPGYLEGEETEEEEDQALDDEDWTLNKEDRDSRPAAKRKQKKTQQQARSKKEQMVSAGEGAGEGEDNGSMAEDASSTPKTLETTQGRRRRKEGDTRWIRKTHSCNECGLMFSTQKKFDQHFNHIHRGIAPWHGEHTCDDCGKIFTQRISLNVHRMFKHGAPRRYQCSQCVYEAPTKEYLKRHMKVHTNERRYVCPHCHKGLKTAESFRNHMVIHTNKGRFVCQVCQKAYNHKGAYHDHIRTHCEYRDYACDYCGSAFKSYKHVARHIRAVHLNDKRFICDVCGAQHMTAFNLKGHLKKHGDLSSLMYAYQCTLCDAKFRGPDGRAAHMKVIHTASPNITDSKNLGVIENETKVDLKGKSLSPHPTRRPVQFHYSKLIREDKEEKVLTTTGNTRGEGDSWGTIYLDNSVDFSPFDGKIDEAVVYEVYSGGEEEELEQLVCNEKEKSHDGEKSDVSVASNKDRVIHVYPCNGCQIMFTCRSVLDQHYETCSQRELPMKEESDNEGD